MSAYDARQTLAVSFRWRAYVLLGLLGIGALALGWRAVDLALVDHGFLTSQGNARFLRVADIAAHRGTIIDRYGEPLAVSTPVDSVWTNPRELALATDQIPRLAAALNLDRQELTRRVTSNLDREFLYLARHLQPAEAQKIRALDIPGVYLTREYRRYFPAGEVAGHILGFTNVDDAGQEGLELVAPERLICGRSADDCDAVGRGCCHPSAKELAHQVAEMVALDTDSGSGCVVPRVGENDRLGVIGCCPH